MSPRPEQLNIETQRNLAYAALGSMDQDERKVLLYWMCEHYPGTFLIVAEDYRGFGRSPAGISDLSQIPPQ